MYNYKEICVNGVRIIETYFLVVAFWKAFHCSIMTFGGGFSEEAGGAEVED